MTARRIDPMPGYYIWTIGCQMNKADSERLAGLLDQAGLQPVSSVDGASVIVLNSCVVRQSAEDRVVGKLGSLKALKRARPDLVLALTGCMVGSEREKAALAKRFAYVDAFLRPLEFGPLLDIVAERGLGGDVQRDCLEMAARPMRVGEEHAVGLDLDGEHDGGIPDALDITPAKWVPVIYGCDYMCTYCIVPFRRGRERSRPLAEIVDEVKGFVAGGAREVTLLGQTIDRYGNDLPGRPDLADLFDRLNDLAGLDRIRFLTSHPSDMSERIVRAIGELPRVCEHVNLPVQAGDDEILARMRRPYKVDEYRRLIDGIRRHVPGASLSTDVIVGFPGETRAQFEGTYRLLEEIGFDVVHVAMYSPRPGTHAARSIPDDVSRAEKKERLRLVEELQAGIARRLNQALLGQTVEILVEERSGGKWQGRTRTNKIVFFADERDWLGELVPLRVSHATAWSLQGELVAEQAPAPGAWRARVARPAPARGAAISLRLVS
ncbi:MAG: tRNA (N6-isopentenyl adenosine(37)-C2)-methylthiotransferase MiaB [Chloroflexi bacterium]|nr:tRNA (N6-isopentenyl adenosine(37)-C2)-methylthiotransferase MiaB [Chloroflexota bacterium]MBI4505147.1 tRNA (N6-isopentenyl adenosine(37)-C2)-methylthiotransferase MiaB [Chloroflexota bacterium]